MEVAVDCKVKVAVERETQVSSLILCLDSLVLNLRFGFSFLFYFMQQKPIGSAHKI